MEQPRWLNERQQRAWRAYLCMSRQLGTRLNRELQSSSGLSDADFEVLVHLSETQDHRLRAFELGAALQWEKSRLSHHLTRMQNRGLVLRRECSHDARGAFIELTEEGLRAIEAAAPRHVEAVRKYLIELLTPEQLDVLETISSVVLANLNADDDPCSSSAS